MAPQRKSQKTVVKDGENPPRADDSGGNYALWPQLIGMHRKYMFRTKRSTPASGATTKAVAKVAKKKPSRAKLTNEKE
jgi:hypothetical protein